MQLIVIPDANGVVSRAGQIIGQILPDNAVMVSFAGETLDLPPNKAAVVTEGGQIDIVDNWIGSGPWFDQQADTAHRLTPIEITDVGVVPASTWAMTPRPETSAEIAAREAAVAAAATAAEAARIADLEVARYAALVALLSAGITEQMIADQLALITNPTERETSRLYFNRPTWRRTSAFISWGKGAFNLTDAQVDALFVAADAID